MPYLLGVLALVSTIAVFIIRAGMVARASRELGDVAADALGAARRARFRRKATRSPLTQLEDPREAVVAMMVAIAKSEGDITQAQMAVMSKIATERLEFDDAGEIIAHARWLTQDATDPGIVAQRVVRLLGTSCSPEQKADILDILKQVASVGREPSPLQLQAIQTLRIRFNGR